MQYLVIPALAWVIAQSLKHVARLFGRNRRVFNANPLSALMLSGGMPSAHSAATVALSVSLGFGEGWGSAVFALSVLFAAVVIYDAIMVRFSSGQQGDALNILLKQASKNAKPLRVAHGHTVVEVVAGAVLGAFVAIVVIYATT